MKKEYTTKDMLDFIKHYDNKKEKDCFDTYEEELEEFLNIRKDKMLGQFSKKLSFSENEINLNVSAIETAIATCDWDSYDKNLYDNPSDQISDMYWLIETLKNK